ncbi:MAG: AAA family ATPase [Paludibacter sp.]
MTNKKEAPSNVAVSEEANNQEQYKNTNFIEKLKAEIQSKTMNFNENDTLQSNKDTGLFTTQSANSWIEQAKSRPIPKMLFSEFWYEREVCILFSDTNLGKSILAVQIANSISQGMPIPGFKLEAKKQSVLYFDFELTEKQFQNRYSENYENAYQFDNNLMRVEINPESEVPETLSFEEYLYNSLEFLIIESKAKILIMDNLTYLRTETEKAKDALPLMKELKTLKNKYHLSLLILAHTPKRDLSKPITRNDLQGSKMLINFCDSSFSIGESSTDKGVRYIKMIKARNTEIIYDSENVCVCNISKPTNFLQFEFLDFGSESHHLKAVSEKEKEELESQIAELIQNEPSISAYAIAKKLCKNENNFESFKVKVGRIVKRSRKTENRNS